MDPVKHSLAIIAERASQLSSKLTPEAEASLTAVEKAAGRADAAFSGSWIGYHSRTYFRNLEVPPPGASFNSITGSSDSYHSGPSKGWEEYDFDALVNLLASEAISPTLEQMKQNSDMARAELKDLKEELLENIELLIMREENAYLGRLKEETEKIDAFRESHFTEYMKPGRVTTTDLRAIGEGVRIPPHVKILATTSAIRSVYKACVDLGKKAGRVQSYLKKTGEPAVPRHTAGNGSVFLGHGRSPVWKDLRRFLEKTLSLHVIEFDSASPAGMSVKERLEEMLDQASFAFIILTGEDLSSTSQLQPRLNVAHEAGLFQGRLGFSRAIILLEEQCKSFSNIDGLIQIRFPKGDIEARFEKIREVLTREGLVGNPV